MNRCQPSREPTFRGVAKPGGESPPSSGHSGGHPPYGEGLTASPTPRHRRCGVLCFTAASRARVRGARSGYLGGWARGRATRTAAGTMATAATATSATATVATAVTSGRDARRGGSFECSCGDSLRLGWVGRLLLGRDCSFAWEIVGLLVLGPWRCGGLWGPESLLYAGFALVREVPHPRGSGGRLCPGRD